MCYLKSFHISCIFFFFLFSCFFSDVPIHRQITPTSISTYHASKYFLFLCTNSSPNYSCQHFHISCIKICPCSHAFYDVPIYCLITPTSISTYHALKYFLVLMFFSDIPIHRQITPASVFT